jgi:amino acid transporter
MPFTWLGLGAAMLGVQWAYHGWMNLTPIAEEIRHPQRNIPLGMLLGLGIIIALYLGANVAYYRVFSHEEIASLAGGTSVAAAFSLRLLGSIGGALAAAAVAVSALGALNGNVLVGPRLLFAMQQDRFVPRSLGVVHARYRTPVLSICVVAAWSCALVLGGAALSRFGIPVVPLSEHWEININLPSDRPLFDVLTDFAMFGAVIFETLAVATIFVFRARMPHAYRPYRCIGYPFVPILYVVLLAAVAVGTVRSRPVEAAMGLGFMVLGVAVYGVFLRDRRVTA